MRSLLFGLWAISLIASTLGQLECNMDLYPQSLNGSCDRSLISKCISSSIDAENYALLEKCLITGGCSAADAAATITALCAYPVVAAKEDTYGDLRKRQKNKGTTSAASEVTDTKASAADKTTSDAQTTTDTPSTTNPPSEKTSATEASSSAPPSTTDSLSSTDSPSTTSASPASTTSDSASSTTLSTILSTTSSPTSSPSTTKMTSTTSSSSTLVCLTTSQMSTTWCITSTNAGTIGSTCIPTFTPVISCAPGLICQTQAAGATSCMVRQNNLTTSGLVVTVIFSTVVFAFLATLCGMCIKSRRASRRRALAREAELLAGMKAKNVLPEVETAPRSYPRGRVGPAGSASDDRLPLIAPTGGNNNGGSRGGSRDASADRRPSAHRIPSGSYQDIVAARAPAGAPRLHPGLMEMGAEEEDDMGYRGARGGR